ncbi:hypothetical protein K502DRAFT_144070 [Neoconidiobolus thromboides FSU 785]|nr:hypothetical protein K502DRAFT_144070 [Neoconidiobolus thromboides FSU 785]
MVLDRYQNKRKKRLRGAAAINPFEAAEIQNEVLDNSTTNKILAIDGQESTSTDAKFILPQLSQQDTVLEKADEGVEKNESIEGRKVNLSPTITAILTARRRTKEVSFTEDKRDSLNLSTRKDNSISLTDNSLNASGILKRNLEHNNDISVSSISYMNHDTLKYIISNTSKNNKENSYNELNEIIKSMSSVELRNSEHGSSTVPADLDEFFDNVNNERKKEISNIVEEDVVIDNNETMDISNISKELDKVLYKMSEKSISPWEIDSDEEEKIRLSISKHRSEDNEISKDQMEFKNQFNNKKNYPVKLNPPKFQNPKRIDEEKDEFSSSSNSNKRQQTNKNNNKEKKKDNEIKDSLLIIKKVDNIIDKNNSIINNKDRSFEIKSSKEKTDNDNWKNKTISSEENNSFYEDNNIQTDSSQSRLPIINKQPIKVIKPLNKEVIKLKERGEIIKQKELLSKRIKDSLKDVTIPLKNKSSSSKSQADIVSHELLQVINQYCMENNFNSDLIKDINLFKGAFETGIIEMEQQQMEYSTLTKELMIIRKEQNELRQELLNLRQESCNINNEINKTLKLHHQSQINQLKMEESHDYVNQLKKFQYLQKKQDEKDINNDNNDITLFNQTWLNLNSDLAILRQRLGLNPLPGVKDDIIDNNNSEAIITHSTIQELQKLNDELDRLLS